ncbi:hypothetical protein CCX46_14860 [Pseudomonas sp. RU47]|uniref:hypothetical protein n=1 Tax=Pseudomonas sp. RU47 TaxID=2005388 RepID=UPI000FDD095F|nr:hypothetical protein [Pseudomonas sp. RU47]AZZ76379.1 hypothetical protein CCX46_14860 [Pseudomonas sp. RU47]
MKFLTGRDKAALKAMIPKLAPLVGADKVVGAYEAIKLVVDSRKEERVNRYCLALLSEVSDVDLNEMDSWDENLDIDFGDLLQTCMDDSDSRKTEAYARLTIAIRLRNLDAEYRRYFILALKQLSSRELELLQRGYVARHWEIIPDAGFDVLNQATVYNPKKLGIVGGLSVEVFRRLGFLNNDGITALGETFVESTHSKDDLTPLALEWRAWQQSPIAVVVGDQRKVAAFKEAMKNYRVKVSELADSVLTDTRNNRVAFTAVVFLGPFGGWTHRQRMNWSSYTDKNPGQCILIDAEGGTLNGRYCMTFSVHNSLDETARSILRHYEYIVDDPIIP